MGLQLQGLHIFFWGGERLMNVHRALVGWILKAPPANPWVYIYQYYNIDQKEGL